MTILKINIGGTGGQLGKYTPLPRLGGALYAGYLLGTDYHASDAFGGSSVDDLSGNGRSLTATGGAYDVDFMEAPFTDDDLFGLSGCTIITVSAAVSGVSNIEAGTFSFPADGKRGIALGQSSDAAKPLTSYNFQGGPQVDLNGGLARSNSVFEFRAATFSPSGGMVYRQRNDIATAQTAVTGSGHNILLPQSVRIGQPNVGSGFDGASKIAAALFASKALNPIQLDDAYSEMKALMGQFSLVI
jgi:hypothetical protein